MKNGILWGLIVLFSILWAVVIDKNKGYSADPMEIIYNNHYTSYNDALDGFKILYNPKYNGEGNYFSFKVKEDSFIFYKGNNQKSYTDQAYVKIFILDTKKIFYEWNGSLIKKGDDVLVYITNAEDLNSSIIVKKF